VFRPLVGNELDAVLQRLARLQGVLGEFNDSDVAVRWLDEWTAKRGRRFARTTLISVGAVIGAYAAQGRLALERFPDFWRRFSRARHRRRLQDVWLRSW
jgi:CHAD domain-containing protein